jgi:hypothetical protein
LTGGGAIAKTILDIRMPLGRLAARDEGGSIMGTPDDAEGERRENGSVSELDAKVVVDLRDDGTTHDWTGAGHELRPPVDELEAASRFVASWLRYFSFPGVRLADDPGAVTSDVGLARCVVFEPRPAGRRIVHEVHAEAVRSGRYPLVFSRTGFTEHAVRWADANPVALFLIHTNGDIRPENQVARRLLEGSDQRHLG